MLTIQLRGAALVKYNRTEGKFDACKVKIAPLLGPSPLSGHHSRRTAHQYFPQCSSPASTAPSRPIGAKTANRDLHEVPRPCCSVSTGRIGSIGLIFLPPNVAGDGPIQGSLEPREMEPVVAGRSTQSLVQRNNRTEFPRELSRNEVAVMARSALTESRGGTDGVQGNQL